LPKQKAGKRQIEANSFMSKQLLELQIFLIVAELSGSIRSVYDRRGWFRTLPE
jgi:hypothetical protein